MFLATMARTVQLIYSVYWGRCRLICEIDITQLCNLSCIGDKESERYVYSFKNITKYSYSQVTSR